MMRSGRGTSMQALTTNHTSPHHAVTRVWPGTACFS